MVPPVTQDRWFAYRKPAPHARRRLFCLPHAGGSASLFRYWYRCLPAEIDLCPIQLPGRETRFGEAPYTRLTDLVPVLVEGIRHELDLPFCLFGHSNGALIAVAIARHLQCAGLPTPCLLVASAHRAPHLPESELPRHRLPDDELLQELKRHDGTPPALFEHPEMVRLLLALYRADLELGETRGPEPEYPLSCQIAAYGGVDDPEVTAEDLDAWRRQTHASFRRRLFPGGHFYVRTAAAELLPSLASDLIEASQTVTREVTS